MLVAPREVENQAENDGPDDNLKLRGFGLRFGFAHAARYATAPRRNQ